MKRVAVPAVEVNGHAAALFCWCDHCKTMWFGVAAQELVHLCSAKAGGRVTLTPSLAYTLVDTTRPDWSVMGCV